MFIAGAPGMLGALNWNGEVVVGGKVEGAGAGDAAGAVGFFAGAFAAMLSSLTG
jgi:hypothetical protein